MNQKGRSLSKNDAARVGRTVRHVETLTRETTNVTPGQQGLPNFAPGQYARPAVVGEPVLWFVEVTGDPPGGAPDLSQLYQGRLWIADETLDPPWRAEDCWIRPLPGKTFEIGDEGTAKLVGWRPAGNGYDPRPIYSFACCGPAAPSPQSGSGSGSSGGSGDTSDPCGGPWPDGGGCEPVVTLGPPLPCVDGERPVISARVYPVFNPATGLLTQWPYDVVWDTECCLECPAGDGSGGSGASGAGSAVGCETYTVGGIVLSRVAAGVNRWRGGDYLLSRTTGGGWTLDTRYGEGRPCVWMATSWDGTGCKTFKRAHRFDECATSVEVCCGGVDLIITGCGPTPANLYAASECCDDMVPISYHAPSDHWIGGTDNCSGSNRFELMMRCVGGIWKMRGSCGTGDSEVPAEPGGTESPFFQTFVFSFFSALIPCCPNPVTITVSETPP